MLKLKSEKEKKIPTERPIGVRPATGGAVHRAGANGRAGGAKEASVVVPPSSSLEDADHQEDDGEHQKEGGNGHANGKLAHADAELLRLGRFLPNGTVHVVEVLVQVIIVASILLPPGVDLHAHVLVALLRGEATGQSGGEVRVLTGAGGGHDHCIVTDRIAPGSGVGGATEPHIALVVDGAGVGELVGVKGDLGAGQISSIFKGAHYFAIHGAAIVVDQRLLAPVEAVADQAVRYLHAKFGKFVTLLLNADAQTELVADFDVLRGGGGLVNVITTTVVMMMTTFGNEVGIGAVAVRFAEPPSVPSRFSEDMLEKGKIEKEANKAAAAAAVQCNNSPPQKEDHHRSSGSRTFSLISAEKKNDRAFPFLFPFSSSSSYHPLLITILLLLLLLLLLTAS
ncbi:hypothetical protein TYRP_018096 [Tyrophagus putrescentiae]|nr:hypothetical protein TYRP_018096 [Tyrophagus putrescentiae]